MEGGGVSAIRNASDSDRQQRVCEQELWRCSYICNIRFEQAHDVPGYLVVGEILLRRGKQ